MEPLARETIKNAQNTIRAKLLRQALAPTAGAMEPAHGIAPPNRVHRDLQIRDAALNGTIEL